ncbi:MAG: Glu/Leu/Phe/Val dehydrogenase [Gammaproteobacteria bacterium]|nr:Glu/Leu/Phe/Val dehydrogenase [Gammaproteobacteria bacterium]
MSIDPFSFADDLGPEKVIHIYDPATGLKAVLVVDNVAAGPAIGGIRIAPDVTVEECYRLARAMTLKNAMAGLAHGGGKSVIIGDPRAPAEEKARLVRSFARAIAQIEDYIPGPDMGTNETSMAQVKDLIGRAVGLPREVGGIPLDEIGATGFGISVALEAAQDHGNYQLSGARVVVQGFGSVGMHAARFLAEKGATLVGVSDSRGARTCPGGFTLDRLIDFKRTGGSVSEFDEGEAVDGADLVGVDCEVWIPAARPDVLRADNVKTMRAKVIAQGANIPATPEAEALLAEMSILVLPDFVANAGGVICAAVEYHQGSEAQALTTIEDKIGTNIVAVLERAVADKLLPRHAALAIARDRIATAMTFRRTF